MPHYPIMLDTPRLRLRDHRSGDLEDHHRLLSSPKVMYYLPDLLTHSLEESRKDLERSIQEIGAAERTYYFLHMEERDSGTAVGEIGYTVTERTPVGKLVHLGYFIFPEFWGRGYTAEALRELLRFAFQEDDVFRVTTGCLRENRRSSRVMEKCGLIREGELKRYTWHDGEMKDRLCYRLLREEWTGGTAAD